jgi:hypothetical protein
MPVRVLWRVLANHFRLDRATAAGLRFHEVGCAGRTSSDFLEGCRRSTDSLSESLQKCYNAYNSYVAEGEAP